MLKLSSAVLKLFEIEPEAALNQTVSFKVFLPVEGTDEVQEIPLNKEYKIIGVIEDEASIFAYIPMSEFSDRFVIPYYDKARVKVEGREFLDAVEDEMLQRGFVVTSLSKTVEQANKIFAGVLVNEYSPTISPIIPKLAPSSDA